MSRYKIDLATARLGGRAVACNDEFFAGVHNLVADAEPIFLPDKYIATGKWMDGWETRRRREPGDDWAIVELGLRGVIDELVVDTAYFRGNFPEACSIEACDQPGRISTAELVSGDPGWRELVARSPLEGDSKNRFEVTDGAPVTHLRLRIYPDGGVARLRVHGRPLPDWDRLDFAGGLVDLVAAENGGRVVDTSDDFFGHAPNLIMPGDPIDMRDGWETRRRRGPGHDWIALALGAPGRIERILVDTSHFKGNAPGECSIEVCDAGDCDAEIDLDAHSWRPLLERTALEPHARHQLTELVDTGRATHVRFRIYPDGGVARLRLWGKSERADRLFAGLARLAAMGEDEARAGFLACCGSAAFADQMTAMRPYADASSLMVAADRVWRGLSEDDWRQAFAAHPRIGETKSGHDASSRWSRGEQAGTATADRAVIGRIAELNAAYEERFGYIYLVCASGKSADQLLAILERRMTHDPADELAIAAEEQRQITRLRLEKWLTQ
jgi:allantoicase